MPLTPQRLKRLVSYRERVERLQEQELGRVNAVRNDRESAFNAVSQEKLDYLRGSLPAGPLDITQLAGNQAYSARLDRTRSARAAALRHSDQQVADAREVLLARSRDRKAMELLLERRLVADRLLARREEAKQLDEAAIARWTPPVPATKGRST